MGIQRQSHLPSSISSLSKAPTGTWGLNQFQGTWVTLESRVTSGSYRFSVEGTLPSRFTSLCNFLISRWNTAGLRPRRWNQPSAGQKLEEGNGRTSLSWIPRMHLATRHGTITSWESASQLQCKQAHLPSAETRQPIKLRKADLVIRKLKMGKKNQCNSSRTLSIKIWRC